MKEATIGMIRLGEFLTKAREAKVVEVKPSRLDVAKATGIDSRVMKGLEAGTRPDVNAGEIMELARYYGITPTTLFDVMEGAPEPKSCVTCCFEKDGAKGSECSGCQEYSRWML